MKYYIIAGEASGDLHAANLMKFMKKYDKEAEFRFWGGDLMQQTGGTIVKHYRETAIMGILEVLKNYKTIRGFLELCKNDLLDYKPDLIILVDYPGFNLRIAEFAKKHNFTIYYYISPKIWAWKKSRVKKIKAFIDKVFVIFPFEIEFYKQFDYQVEYFGNPTVYVIEESKKNKPDYEEFIRKNNLSDKPIIGILAGSRRQEIKRILPEMLKAIKHFTDYQFVIAGLTSIGTEFYKKVIGNADIAVIIDQTYDLMHFCKAAIVTSGTATLEIALFDVPQVVCYKTSGLTFLVGSIVLTIKYISLVNLILDQLVVKEIIQTDMEKRIRKELKKLIKNEEYRKEMLEKYQQIREILGEKNSPEKSAEIIIRSLKKQI